MAAFPRTVRQLGLACTAAALLAPPLSGIELKPDTAAAFDRYIHATELRMAGDLADGCFLAIDCLSDARRNQAYGQLRQSHFYIERLLTREDVGPIQIPGGLVHHWVGVGFIPGATLAQTLAVLQDYDNHKTTYKPDVRDSKLLRRNSNEFEVYLQLYQKSLVAVVVNVNLEVQYTRLDATRAMSKSYSKRIAELVDVGRPTEHELPVGNDHGYIWRLYTYWRIEEKDRGVYIQAEALGLSRTIPWAISWLVTPLTRNIPRSVLSDLLLKTSTAIKNSAPSHAAL